MGLRVFVVNSRHVVFEPLRARHLYLFIYIVIISTRTVLPSAWPRFRSVTYPFPVVPHQFLHRSGQISRHVTLQTTDEAMSDSEAVVEKRRGRPAKDKSEDSVKEPKKRAREVEKKDKDVVKKDEDVPAKRGRGRPPKSGASAGKKTDKPKSKTGKRGRPKKSDKKEKEESAEEEDSKEENEDEDDE